MGNSQLFQFERKLIEAKYRRVEQWAATQLTRATDLADATPLTLQTIPETLQYAFGIQWNREQKTP